MLGGNLLLCNTYDVRTRAHVIVMASCAEEFSPGMEDWTRNDSDEEFQPPKQKRQKKLSLSTKKKQQPKRRFEQVSKEEAEACADGVVPKNTEKNDL